MTCYMHMTPICHASYVIQTYMSYVMYMYVPHYMYTEGSRAGVQTGLRATSGTVSKDGVRVSVKSDRVQRTEAVSWTIRTRSQVDVE